MLTEFKERLRPWKHRITREHDLYWLVRQLQRIRKDRPVKTVLDIGASVGRMATLFATAFPDAIVHCFEPNPAPRELQLRPRLARFQGRTVIHACGLGAENSTRDLRIYAKPESSSFLAIQPYMMHDNAELYTRWVDVRRLDDLADINHVDLMKIDVEGTELDVLRGAERTLDRTETVYVEISPMRHGPHDGRYIETFERLHRAGLTYVTYCGDCLFSRDPEVQRLG